ncbi:MAG: hypothetical protein HND56_04280 [Pseudomonadota bacterium]|nr:hypothetical protein [Pseudomonadota bacterium]QKK04956.1 MAG: hypothetical protein HND56_04280 [Pseudomonadota bacterium]
MTGFAAIKKAIIDSLSYDLLEPKYRATLAPDDPPETGHCAVASEAFYHMAGGREAGYMPVVCGYAVLPSGEMVFDKKARQQAEQNGARRETHWWIRGPQKDQRGKGTIFDVTVKQYAQPFPYENGHNTGFMQPQQKPSRRAQIIIDRVTEKLGAEKLAAFRRANIEKFRKAGGALPQPRRKKPQP